MTNGASSRPGARSRTKDGRTGKRSRQGTEPETDWPGLRAKSAREIRAGLAEDADIQPTDADFWKDAELRAPQRKEAITIRLDADLLGWFRRHKGYQTRINAVLRAYMKAHGGNGD